MKSTVQEIVDALDSIGNVCGQICKNDMDLAKKLEKTPVHHSKLCKTGNGYTFDEFEGFFVQYIRKSGGFCYYLSWDDEEWDNDEATTLAECQRLVGKIIQSRFEVRCAEGSSSNTEGRKDHQQAVYGLAESPIQGDV